MGDVYAAYDPELDRKIAVKLLRARPTAGQSTSEGRTRLLREAQAIAKLSHGNVVVVYDVGTFQDVVFIAMEFIEGDTVRYWLNAGEKSWQEVLRVFVAAGRGLAAAHDAGLVHRDFKPDNVMVGRDGKVRVMDFGLARQTGAADLPSSAAAADEIEKLKSESEDSLSDSTVNEVAGGTGPVSTTPAAADDIEATRVLPASGASISQSRRTPLERSVNTAKALQTNLTQTGAMLGTPAYMAPEQFASKVGDARTDQFSFCVALYESIYGERPFEGKSFMALMNSVAKGIVREPPAGTRVPVWIRKVMLRGLSPVADARYPSMTELLNALEKDPSIARRRRAMAAATTLLIVGVLFGAARNLQARHSPCEGGALKLDGVWEPGAAPTARKEAIRNAFAATRKSYAARTFDTVRNALDKYTANWTRTYTDACEATALRAEQSAEVLDLRMSCLQGRLDSVKALTDLFAHADGQTVENATSAVGALGDLERCSDLTILRAVVKPPDDPVTRGRVQLLKPRLARVKALSDAGHVSEALALARPLVDEVRAVGYLPLTAQALRRLADLVTANPAETESVAEQAVWAAQAGGDDEVVAETATFQVFHIGYREADTKRARLWIELADSTLRRLGGHDLWRAWLVNNQGLLAEAEGRYDDAIKAHKRAVELKEKILGPGHPDVATSLGNQAIALVKLKRVTEALEVNQRALEIDAKSLGADHPEVALLSANRADALNLLERFGEAEPLARSSIKILERELGANDTYVAVGLCALGRSLLGRGLAQEARPFLQRAYTIREQTEKNPARLAEAAFLLAQAMWPHRAERPKALVLGFEAKRHYLSSSNKESLVGVEQWLQAHDAF